MPSKPKVSFDVFAGLDIRAGRVIRAEPFPEARKPAIKLWVDFGDDVGTLQSSAQLTKRYAPESLVGATVLAVINFESRKVAGFESQILVLGMMNPDNAGDVVLVRPDDAEVIGWQLG